MPPTVVLLWAPVTTENHQISQMRLSKVVNMSHRNHYFVKMENKIFSISWWHVDSMLHTVPARESYKYLSTWANWENYFSGIVTMKSHRMKFEIFLGNKGVKMRLSWNYESFWRHFLLTGNWWNILFLILLVDAFWNPKMSPLKCSKVVKMSYGNHYFVKMEN